MEREPDKHTRPKWVYWAIAAAGAVLVIVLIVHLSGGGMGGHGL